MASLLKKIPLTDRLNLYIYVLIIVYIIVFLENIQIGKTVFFSKLVPVLTGCFLIAGNILSKNMNFINFINDSSGGSEVNPLIKHVEKTIAADEYFYSYIRANFVVRYKTGYTNRIGNTSSQNIIYGQNSFDWMGVEFDRAAVPDVPWDIQWDYGKDGVYPNEITRVVDAGKCWILFAQTNSPDFEQMTRYGLDKLREQGTVTQVMNVHDTYLYYFQAHE
jgi:hypothetical protein